MLNDVFRLEPFEKINKVTDLKTAVAAHVKEGMSLYITRSSEAAVAEIVRQFWDKKPGFTLMMNLPGGAQAMALVHRQLVKKLIFTTCADLYPSPSPNPIIQRAYRHKTVEFENWSVLSFTQALMAGALNLPFMPTLSISGSEMVDENRHGFLEIADPFEGEKIGVVKRMNPDVALFHGWAADAAGNTLLVPYGDDREWGAKAATGAVIVTVERIVSTEFIREHSNLVKIPGYMVDAVCHAPFGAHPRAMNNRGLPEFDAYDVDVPFLQEFREAAKDPEALDGWVSKWILDCDSHEARLRKLGPERIYRLKGKAAKDNWPIRQIQVEEKARTPRPSNEIEFAIVAASRKIEEVFVNGGFKVIFAGIGIGGLASWLAYYRLKEKGHEVYMAGAGIGFDPRPADPLMSSSGNISTSRMLTDAVDIHGVTMGGVRRAGLGILGAAQIDKQGNINSSKVSATTYIGGAGGGNDIANGAKEVVVITKQKKARFLDRVSYVTCAGKRVTTVISHLGIFEKKDGELVLTTCFGGDGATEAEMVEKIRAECGWDLKTAATLKMAGQPEAAELALIRTMDPEGVFI